MSKQFLASDIPAPIRVAVWGLGKAYRTRAALLQRMQQQGQVQLVAAVDSRLQPMRELDGMPVMLPAALDADAIDYVLVMNVYHADEIVAEAVTECGIPREKLLIYRVLDIPGFDFIAYQVLRDAHLSILSNDRWTRIVCELLQIPCRSPFDHAQMGEEDYLRLLENLPAYLAIDTPCYRGQRIDCDGGSYHSFALDDIEVRLDADVSSEKAWARWREGCACVDRDALFLEMSTCDPARARRFDELCEAARRICLVPFDVSADHVLQLPLAEGQKTFRSSVELAAHGSNLGTTTLLDLLLGQETNELVDMNTGESDLRVAIWGYSMYGRHVHQDLMLEGGYQVVDIFDQAMQGTTDETNSLAIRDPQELVERFAIGAFDAVVVGAGNPDVAEKMRASLEAWGIPRAPYQPDAVVFHGAEHFSLTDPGLEITQRGYRLSCLADAFGTVAHRPQILLHIFDAEGSVLEDNWLEGDERWERAVGQLPAFSAAQLSEAKLLEGSWCACARLWATNYCHVTFQTFDQIALMEEAGYQGGYLLARSSFAPALLTLMGVDPARVCWMDDLVADVPYRFERLYVLRQDYSSFDIFSRNSVPALMKLVARIEAHLPPMPQSLPKRLFVKRIGTRKLLGAEELLARYGFTTIVPEDLSVAEQISYFHAADVVVTPHGANSTNSIYMRPGAVFVEVFSCDWGFPWSDDLLLCKGVHYLPVVQSHTSPRFSNGDYCISETILEHALINAIALVERDESHGLV